jgi:hypothetical protein
MLTLLIVTHKEACEFLGCLLWRLVIFSIHLLIFDRPPQALDKDVVQCSPSPIHTNLNPRRLQEPRKLQTRKLCPLITIKNGVDD